MQENGGLFKLMFLLEELMNLLNQKGISYWIDWGTMLGYVRHQNVIPWDNDCDLCMLSDDYDHLIQVFSCESFRIGRLSCLPDAYADQGCLWIRDAEDPESPYGIDIIKYRIVNEQVKNCMNEKTCNEYPCAPGSSYDFKYDEIFPLRTGIMVGILVSLPHKIEELVLRGYGSNFMEYSPRNSYLAWLAGTFIPYTQNRVTENIIDTKPENSKRYKYLSPPFKLIKEFDSLRNAFVNYKEEPFIIRKPNEFEHVRKSDLQSLFEAETQVLSWYETESELFNESYHDGKKLFDNWLRDELKYNIVDAPNKHLELLPSCLRNNSYNLSEDARQYAICYALTKNNNLTKYHVDLLGDGWVYLTCGSKIWHIIDRKDVEYLEAHGYSLMTIKDLNLTELVFLLDGYLWGKIRVGFQDFKDFIYFPRLWAHRVITYDKSFGICGYTSTTSTTSTTG